MARRSHLYRAKFIPKIFSDRQQSFRRFPAMMLDLFETKMESNMINKLLGAAAMAAVILAVAPASAAKMGGCSGDNMMKTENAVEAMADGPNKSTGQKEIMLAQTAMLDGKMGECAVHIHHAMQAGMVK
jgi:hypothetical protein